MPISFNKKELEKKKVQKRKNKQQRKNERKAGGTKSFEEMIAYVDENGVITDTPPETIIKSALELDEIIISTPKQDAKAETI